MTFLLQITLLLFLVRLLCASLRLC